MKSRESAAEYVLGELDERRREEFERKLAADPELGAEVEALRAMTGQLEELPANAWPRPGEAGAAADASAPRRTGAVRPALALAMVLAGLVVGGVVGAALNGGGDSGGSTPAPVLTLDPLDAPPAPAPTSACLPPKPCSCTSTACPARAPTSTTRSG